MIIESNQATILFGTYDTDTDISAFSQYGYDEAMLITKSHLAVDFSNRQIIGLEKWANNEDTTLQTIKDINEEILGEILDNFPLSVIKNYLL